MVKQFIKLFKYEFIISIYITNGNSIYNTIYITNGNNKW